MLSWERRRYIRVLRRRSCVRGVRKCVEWQRERQAPPTTPPLNIFSFFSLFFFSFLHIIHHFCLVSSAGRQNVFFLPHFYFQPVVWADGNRHFSESTPSPSNTLDFFLWHVLMQLFPVPAEGPIWSTLKVVLQPFGANSFFFLSQIVSKVPKDLSLKKKKSKGILD